MYILRKNKGNDIPTMVVECHAGGYGTKMACGSLLEIEANDILLGNAQIDEGVNIAYHYIICPVCKAKVEVEYRLIPTEIRKLL